MSEEKLLQTPSQTVGPYFAYGLTPDQYLYDFAGICDGNLILDESIEGERITIFGQVFDGEGDPVTDAMIEIWQADSHGDYLINPDKFHGFGRYGTGTAADCRFEFKTIKPGSIGEQAPHISIIIFMRGLLSHAYSRIYFSDETEANANDKLLNSVDMDRQSTLIAQKSTLPDDSIGYEFNIFMQGEKETVFYDV